MAIETIIGLLGALVAFISAGVSIYSARISSRALQQSNANLKLSLKREASAKARDIEHTTIRIDFILHKSKKITPHVRQALDTKATLRQSESLFVLDQENNLIQLRDHYSIISKEVDKIRDDTLDMDLPIETLYHSLTSLDSILKQCIETEDSASHLVEKFNESLDHFVDSLRQNNR